MQWKIRKIVSIAIVEFSSVIKQYYTSPWNYIGEHEPIDCTTFSTKTTSNRQRAKKKKTTIEIFNLIWTFIPRRLPFDKQRTVTTQRTTTKINWKIESRSSTSCSIWTHTHTHTHYQKFVRIHEITWHHHIWDTPERAYRMSGTNRLSHVWDWNMTRTWTWGGSRTRATLPHGGTTYRCIA